MATPQQKSHSERKKGKIIVSKTLILSIFGLIKCLKQTSGDNDNGMYSKCIEDCLIICQHLAGGKSKLSASEA